MQEETKKKIWMDHVRKNRPALEKALDMYDEAWYNVRNQMAEQGGEVTPDELKALMELIKDTLQILDEKEND